MSSRLSRTPPALSAGHEAPDDAWIPNGDAGGEPMRARVHGRRGRHAQAVPLVLHFHAGAFVSGSPDTGSAVARLMAEVGAVVVSIDYPLAPQHPFPQAVEAGHHALRWMAAQRSRLAGSQAMLFVAGEEAGGNLAAAVALMARDRQGPLLAGQVLLSPMLDVCVATASLRHAQAGPVGCRWADGWHQYLPHASDASHPYATPGAGIRLAGLPRTLLVTAQDDPLRDEALAYAGRLREASVPLVEAVLDIPTRWPVSYLDCGDASAEAARCPPWAGAVRAQLAAFFSNP